MEHLVKFQTAEGREGQHTAGSLDDALRFVERLRNNEGAGDVRVYRLHEVPIEFKAYFKVELRSADDLPAETPAEASDVPEGPRLASVAASAGASPDDGEGNGRRLFSRS